MTADLERARTLDALSSASQLIAARRPATFIGNGEPSTVEWGTQVTLRSCRECEDQVSTEAEACPHCGAPDPVPEIKQGECYGCGQHIEIEEDDPCPYCDLHQPLKEHPIIGEGSSSSATGRRTSHSRSEKSDGLAALLGLVLGPVGLWYKRNWAAGFAWLAGAVILGAASGGLLAPVLWVGMAIHAYSAEVQ